MCHPLRRLVSQGSGCPMQSQEAGHCRCGWNDLQSIAWWRQVTAANCYSRRDHVFDGQRYDALRGRPGGTLVIGMSWVVAHESDRRHGDPIGSELGAGSSKKRDEGACWYLRHVLYTRCAFLRPCDPEAAEDDTSCACSEQPALGRDDLDLRADERCLILRRIRIVLDRARQNWEISAARIESTSRLRVTASTPIP